MKKTGVWILYVVVIGCRAFSLLFNRTDPLYALVPRSYLGGGFQVLPSLLDLAGPFFIIACLWPTQPWERLTRKSVLQALGDALWLLTFPLAAGLALLAYEDRWHVSLSHPVLGVARCLAFVAAYAAANMLMNVIMVKSRWARLAIATPLVLCLGPLQDVPLDSDSLMLLFGFLMSVGTTLLLTVLAFQRRYRRSPSRATLAAGVTGALSCLLVVTGPSNSEYTFFLPLLAFIVGALSMNTERSWPRWAALSGVTALGLFLSLGLPRLVSPEVRERLIESKPVASHTESLEGVTVRYEDVRVREVARRLAHVLAAANRISRETYGVSPEADELIIWGLKRGGLYADFPHRICGNLSSAREIELALDGAFLNSPNGSIHFPDPVNAILHEYSHLYGSVPYMPWLMGAEEEGWATFSATRLSRRLFERFGPQLWNPPYDYASRAEAIARSTLAGHPVYWSHAEEFGGFRLWDALAKRDGEVAIYRTRWALTRRDLPRWWLQLNDPPAARRMAETLGLADFVSFGSSAPARYDQVYSLQDAQEEGAPLGKTAAEVKEDFEWYAHRPVDPGVKVPPSWFAFADGVASLILLLAAVAVRWGASVAART